MHVCYYACIYSAGTLFFYKMTYVADNVYSWDPSSEEVDKGLMIMDLQDDEGEPVDLGDDLKDPIGVDLDQTEAMDNKANMSNVTRNDHTGLTVPALGHLLLEPCLLYGGKFPTGSNALNGCDFFVGRGRQGQRVGLTY